MPSDFARTRRVFEEGIADGLQLGAQLFVSRDGSPLIDLSMGESRPGVEMGGDTVNLWMSSVKPITALAVGQIWERGLLDLDEPVAKHIPEFGVKGKESITIRHVLTHTGGFRAVIGMNYNDDYATVVRKTCAAPLEPRWVPGEKAGYHSIASWYILAELVRRLDGRPIERYAREAIFELIGMRDCWLGMPADAYDAYGERIGYMFDTAAGTSPPKESRDANASADAAIVRPSGNGRGPIRELAKFYEMLMSRGVSAATGRRLASPQTIDAMTARHRVGMFDESFKRVVDFGLGFVINSNHYGAPLPPYGYGAHAGRRTFGHSGHQSSCAFCDPDRRLVVAWFCNGMPGDAKHHERQGRINTAIYEDLGIG